MNFVPSLKKASFPLSDQWYNAYGKIYGRGAADKDERGFRQQLVQRLYSPWQAGHPYNITCKWEPFRKQILTQWARLTAQDVDAVGPNRSRLAMLIENKYGIASHLVENYLRNFERTLPLI